MMKRTALQEWQEHTRTCHCLLVISRGFTLVEMMITVAILAVLLAIATPSFNSALLGSRLTSYANNLVASANLARSEAVKRNANISLCVSSNGTSCESTGEWKNGWIVACKTNDSIVCNASGTSWLIFHHQHPASSGVTITETSSNLSEIVFPSTGVGVAPGILKICRAIPSPGSQERIVTINSTGRTFVQKTTTGTC